MAGQKGKSNPRLFSLCFGGVVAFVGVAILIWSMIRSSAWPFYVFSVILVALGVWEILSPAGSQRTARARRVDIRESDKTGTPIRRMDLLKTYRKQRRLDRLLRLRQILRRRRSWIITAAVVAILIASGAWWVLGIAVFGLIFLGALVGAYLLILAVIALLGGSDND